MAARRRKHAEAIDSLFDLQQIDGNKRRRVVLRAETKVPVSLDPARLHKTTRVPSAKATYDTAHQEVAAALKDTQFLYTFTHDLKDEISKLSDSPAPVEEELPEPINNSEEDLEDAVLHHPRSGKVGVHLHVCVIQSLN
jgi:hypothetical protein